MKVCDAEASGAYIQQAREAARVAGLAVPSHAEKWDSVPKRVRRTRLVRVRECGDGWRRVHSENAGATQRARRRSCRGRYSAP